MVKAIENSFNEASLPIYFNNVQSVVIKHLPGKYEQILRYQVILSENQAFH